RERFLGAGMNDYVTKPVDRWTLSNVVLQWAQPDNSGMSQVTDADSGVLLIDEDQLRTLGQDTSPDLVPKLVAVFVSELGTRARGISQGLESGDTKRLASEAHALKSSASTYGATAIAECARRIDQACKDENRVEAVAQGRALIDLVESTVVALRAHPLARG
ncbi:MAG: Hpt domain-containing protein, partial [Gammaproteobacteria bacterium]